MSCSQAGSVLLPPAVLRRIREIAEAAWPEEACGLLEGLATEDPVRPGARGAVSAWPPAGRLRLIRALVCANTHPAPRSHYEIDPETFLRADHAASARGRSIVGVWRSHPHGDARASRTDRETAWPGWSYLIAGVTNGVMTDLQSWRLGPEGFVRQTLQLDERRPE